MISRSKLTDSGGLDGGGGGGGGGNDIPSTASLSRSSSSRGSFRKILPSVPDMDQQLTMAAKMIDRKTSTKKGNHSYAPYFLEYHLLAEYNLLQKQSLSGVYVIPSAASPLVWSGVIFIRQGLYQEGIFRFNLLIPENYPDGDVPSVIFDTPVFHPLVDPVTGELEVKKGFADKWRTNVNFLWHVLLYLRRIFYKIETNNPLNPEAAVLYESDHEMFQMRVRACVDASKDRILDAPSNEDAHGIVFSEYQPAIHDPVRQELKRERGEQSIDGKESPIAGMSWIQPETMTIFSKENS